MKKGEKLKVRGERREKPMCVLACILLCAVVAFAAPKSASAYYSDAAFQYIENRLPTAEITCNEGLQYYPNDQKLQMLLDRIHEAKDQQQNENQKNDPKNDQNKDQNQDQNQQNQDQNQNNQDQNQQNQNQDQQNQNSGESSSSSGDQDQQNQDQQNGGQSSDSNANSSNSNGGASEQPQQPEDQNGSSDSQGGEDQQPQETPATMSPEDAAQLLKDFDEQNGERKPWKPVRGQARPLKDW